MSFSPVCLSIQLLWGAVPSLTASFSRASLGIPAHHHFIWKINSRCGDQQSRSGPGGGGSRGGTGEEGPGGGRGGQKERNRGRQREQSQGEGKDGGLEGGSRKAGEG